MEEHQFRDIVDKVKQQIDILQVIGRRIQLDHNNKALCPFHEETVPSFSVNPKGQYFHCFGCGAGGDVIRFIELYDKRPFKDALLALAEESGISIPEFSPEYIDNIVGQRAIREILKETVMYYHRALTAEAKTYLINERDFTEAIINRFLIGYAKGGLREYLTVQQGYSPDTCINAGVLKKASDGRIKDYFYNRIIFPNLCQGNVVHITGRIFGSEGPKYLHLPGEIKYLYNEEALSNDAVIIAEGVPDCLTAVQAGYPAVAILGTSNFKESWLPKFLNCETVYICMDADEAGRQAALRIGEALAEKGRAHVNSCVNSYFKQRPFRVFSFQF